MQHRKYRRVRRDHSYLVCSALGSCMARKTWPDWIVNAMKNDIDQRWCQLIWRNGQQQQHLHYTTLAGHAGLLVKNSFELWWEKQLLIMVGARFWCLYSLALMNSLYHASSSSSIVCVATEAKGAEFDRIIRPTKPKLLKWWHVPKNQNQPILAENHIAFVMFSKSSQCVTE